VQLFFEFLALVRFFSLFGEQVFFSRIFRRDLSYAGRDKHRKASGEDRPEAFKRQGKKAARLSKAFFALVDTSEEVSNSSHASNDNEGESEKKGKAW
jgi:hypothetical protein